MTNGYYLGLLDSSGQTQIFSPFFSDPIVFKDDSFPRENDVEIEAETLDSISNSFFTVSYDKSNSIIYSYYYSGAPDITMLKTKESSSNCFYGTFLLNVLYSYAFSPIIPKNFISCSKDVLNDNDNNIYSFFIY